MPKTAVWYTEMNQRKPSFMMPWYQTFCLAYMCMHAHVYLHPQSNSYWSRNEFAVCSAPCSGLFWLLHQVTGCCSKLCHCFWVALLLSLEIITEALFPAAATVSNVLCFGFQSGSNLDASCSSCLDAIC